MMMMMMVENGREREEGQQGKREKPSCCTTKLNEDNHMRCLRRKIGEEGSKRSEKRNKGWKIVTVDKRGKR